MAFPSYVLKGLQMQMSQKIGLASIFSLATIVVLFDLLRIVYSVEGARGGAGGVSTSLWVILEAIVAVTISCLPVYRTIFSWRKRQRKEKGTYQDLTGRERLVRTQQSFELGHLNTRTDSKSQDQRGVKKAVAGRTWKDIRHKLSLLWNKILRSHLNLHISKLSRKTQSEPNLGSPRLPILPSEWRSEGCADLLEACSANYGRFCYVCSIFCCLEERLDLSGVA